MAFGELSFLSSRSIVQVFVTEVDVAATGTAVTIEIIVERQTPQPRGSAAAHGRGFCWSEMDCRSVIGRLPVCASSRALGEHRG